MTEKLAAPLKVLLLSPTPPPIGGIARWTTLVTDALAEDPRVEVHLVDTKLRAGRITNRSPLLRLTNGLRGASSVWRRVALVIKRESPHVAHLNSSGSFGLVRDIVTMTYLRARGIPVVLHLRFGRVPAIVEAGGYEARILRVATRISSKVIALESRTAAAINLYSDDEKAVCIPNFAPATAETGSDSLREPTILFTGHVVESKGVVDLAQAWVALGHKGPWRLQLAGPVELEMRARLSSIPGVEVLGPLSPAEVSEHLARARIFVLPSHTEGFPNSLLEGMHAGCACIGSDVGAIPEMLAGSAGIVVGAHDTAGLAAALTSVIDDPHNAALRGHRARSKAIDLYSPAAVVPRYLEVWTALHHTSASKDRNAS